MIKIPEDLLAVIKDDALKAIAMFDRAKEPSSLSFADYKNFYQAKVFIQKLKMDIWLMQQELWQAVWGNVLKSVDFKYKDVTYLTEPDYCCDWAEDINDFSTFTVSYKINKKTELNLSLALYWQEAKIYVYSSLNDNNGIEYPIISEPTDLIEIKQLSENEEYYNRSKNFISLNDSETISDDDIARLKDCANEILNTNFDTIILRGKRQ